MQKLIPEQIIRTVIAPLTQTDRQELSDRKNKQLLVIISVYIIISGFCALVWKTGSGSMNLDNKSFRVHFSDSDTYSFQMLVPYICGFIFLVTTFFFVKFFVQSIIPLIRGIRNGKKSLLYYIPVKSTETSVNSYCLSTPLHKNQQVKVSREEFESIGEKEELCLEIVSDTVIVLRLTKGQKVIKYH
jgi:hypothetical protein